jgi:hypothetical protein
MMDFFSSPREEKKERKKERRERGRTKDKKE